MAKNAIARRGARSTEFRDCLGCGVRFRVRPRGHRSPGRGRFHDRACARSFTGREMSLKRGAPRAVARRDAEYDLPCPAEVSGTGDVDNVRWVAVHRRPWHALKVERGGFPNPKCRVCRADLPYGSVKSGGSPACAGACADEFERRKAETRRNTRSNIKHRRRERGEPRTFQSGGQRILRRAIFDRDGWACYLCSVALTPPAREWTPTMATLDHVVPLARGGKHDASNLRACCARCNSLKADRLEPVVV